MKKIVPDPPHLRLIDVLYSTIHPDLIPPDALAIANDLLLSINQTLTEYCRTHPGAPGLNTLSNAATSANTASTLIQHALTRL